MQKAEIVSHRVLSDSDQRRLELLFSARSDLVTQQRQMCTLENTEKVVA